MSTKLTWAKAGLKISFDVSAQASPRVQQAYPLPDVAVLSAQMLKVALETVAQTGRKGIRVSSSGTDGFPGTAGAVFTIIHTAVQDEITSTEEIRISGRTANVLLDQPIPNAVHSFALRRVDAGQTVTWPVVSITTPGDSTLSDIAAAKAAAAGAELVAAKASTDARNALSALEDLSSDDVLTIGEKGTVLKDWKTISQEQAGIDAHAVTFGLTTEKTSYDTALSALTTYLATLTSPTAWNSLTGSTTIVGDTFRTKWTDVYSARQTLLNALVSKAKELADAAQGTATSAATAAAAAQTTAINASSDAASAISQLKDLASDNILSAVEKPAVISDYAVLVNEQAGIDSQATTYAITTEKTAYDSALSSLATYLGTLTSPTAWNALTGDTTIVGTTFRTKFTAAYGARQTLLNAIATKAKSLVTTAQSTADSASTAAATAQTTATAATTAAATAQTAADTASANALSAINQLANLASDNILSAVEKPSVIEDYAVLVNEQAGIDAQATTYAITTEKTAYDTALSTLATYLGTLTSPTAWNALTGDTTIVGTTFRTNFTNAYGARQTLLNAIATKAKTLVVTAQSTADSASTAAATAAIPTVVGDGATTQFIFVSAPVTRTDWQGGSRTNLLLYSQMSAGWSINGFTGTPAQIAQDGTLSAYQMVATGSAPNIMQGVTLPVGTYTLSMWVKGVGNSIGKTATLWAWNAGAGITSPVNAAISQALTGTWTRMVVTFSVTTAGPIYLRLDAPDHSAVVGDTVYVSGAQCEPGSAATANITTTAAAVTVYDVSPTLLYQTARTNMLSYSQDFSGWDKSASLTTGIAAPDGTATGAVLTGTAVDSNIQHGLTLTSGQTYTASIWLKVPAGTLTVSLILADYGGGYTRQDVTLTTTWQRFSVTRIAAATGSAPARFQVGGFSLWGSSVVIHAWGAQVESGTITPYIVTTSAAVTVTDYTVSAGVATLATAPLVGAVLRGLATNASAVATGAQTGVSQINSVDCLTNADKTSLMQAWASELATQGTSSTVGSLDYQAAQAGVSSAAYDAAVTNLSTGLIAAGAPSTWASTWPDGTPLTSMGIAASLKAWWAAIATARTALQNAISQVGITAGAKAIAAAPKLVSTIAAVTPPVSYSYSDGNMVMDVTTGCVWTCASNAWVQASIPTSTIVGYLSAGCIGTSQLAALAVTAAKLSASAVTADKIAANAVTAAKLATNVALVSQVISSTGFISGGVGSANLGVSGGSTGKATGWAFYGSPVATLCNNGWPGTSGSTGWTSPSVLVEIGSAASIVGYEVGALALSKLVNSGYIAWDTAGTYTWTCPPNVTQVDVLLQAGGGGGYGSTSGGGGGGGGAVKGRAGVIPGQSYTIVVGAAGGLGMAGGLSSFAITSQTASVYATGGLPGQSGAGGAGGGGKFVSQIKANTNAGAASVAAIGLSSMIIPGGGGGDPSGDGGGCQGYAGGIASGTLGGGGASASGVGPGATSGQGIGAGGACNSAGSAGFVRIYF